MARRKSGGLKRPVKLEAMKLEKPPKIAAKLPVKGIEEPKVKSLAAKIPKPRLRLTRQEKPPKAPALKQQRRKKG